MSDDKPKRKRKPVSTKPRRKVELGETDPEALSAREAAFVGEYLKDLNAARAAVAVGYSPRSAARMAYRLLQMPRVAAAVQIAKSEQLAATDVSAKRILAELARIGFANIGDIVDVSGEFPRLRLQSASRDVLASLSEITVDALAAPRAAGGDADDAEGPAPAIIRVKVKQHDKLGALNLLGQHAGLWGKRVDSADDSETARMFVELARAMAGTVPVGPPAPQAAPLAAPAD